MIKPEDLAKRAFLVANGASDPLLAGAEAICRKLLQSQETTAEAQRALKEIEAAHQERMNELVGAGAQASMLMDMLRDHVQGKTMTIPSPSPSPSPSPPIADDPALPMDPARIPSTTPEPAPPLPAPDMPNPFDKPEESKQG